MSAPVVTVGEVADQIRGVTYSKGDARSDPAPGLVPVLRAGNISEAGLDFADLVYVPVSRVSEKQFVRRNDVVIAASSGSLDVVGKAARATTDFAGGFGAFCKVLRPDNAVDAAYFAHFFRTQHYRRRVAALAAGANINNLKNEHLNDLVLPLPTLDEQRRIAAILDQADALRAKRRQTLAHLDDLTQSIFLDMFGGGTFGDVALADLALGFRYGTSTKSGDAGLPTLRIPNVVGGALDLTELKLVAVPDAEARRLALQTGDLLFVRTNGNPHNVGRCAVFEPRVAKSAGLDASRFIYASYLIRLRPNRDLVEPSFLREFLLGSAGRRQLRDRSKTSAGQYNINIEGIGSVRVPEVAIADQREFSSRVAEIHSHRIDFQVSADSLDQLFASLQSRAFSGQL